MKKPTRPIKRPKKIHQQPLFADAPGWKSGQATSRDIVEQWMANKPTWLDGYQTLKARNVPYREAMLSVWLSLSKDDRGLLKTRDDFARFMGVSRQVTYQWEWGHKTHAEDQDSRVRQYAELLQVMRMRGERLAEVDEVTYKKAIRRNSAVSDRTLYYQRAGVWKQTLDLHHMGADEGPVEYVDVSQAELDAIREALASEAQGSRPPG